LNYYAPFFLRLLFATVGLAKQKLWFNHISECGLFVTRRRLFDRLECKNCVFKGGGYCWNQCPYNIWRKYQLPDVLVQRAFDFWLEFFTYAAFWVYVFHQTLEVPGTAIKIYQSDGITPIPNDSAISNLWKWNSTANQFELIVVIKNTGTNDVTIAFSHTAPSDWVVNYSGVTTIAKGGSETAIITAVPPSTEPGTLVTFAITISTV
jgi:hypothetical protein